ncbi:cold shock protein cspC [Coprobacillus sp. CAG:826]|jgi:CspA family cold shock protein|nr:cold shock domain-containing protein [Coprobacillus sp.]CDD92230.1 cold shock protein cspC [Coprobacillus sp. CAG:826]
MLGKVKWFNAEKGFGFINRGEGADIFVHYSQIMENGYRSLEEGQSVEFELFETERGLQARNVVKIS